MSEFFTSDGIHFNQDKLRLLAKRADMITQLVLTNHPIVIFELLSDMGIASNTVDQIKEREQAFKIDMISVGRDPRDTREHDAFHDAMEESLAAVEAAFDKVIEASFQMIQILENCPCRRCVQRRQANNAPIN